MLGVLTIKDIDIFIQAQTMKDQHPPTSIFFFLPYRAPINHTMSEPSQSLWKLTLPL